MKKTPVTPEDKYRFIVNNCENLGVEELSKETGFSRNYIYNILSKARMFGFNIHPMFRRGRMKDTFKKMLDEQKSKNVKP